MIAIVLSRLRTPWNSKFYGENILDHSLYLHKISSFIVFLTNPFLFAHYAFSNFAMMKTKTQLLDHFCRLFHSVVVFMDSCDLHLNLNYSIVFHYQRMNHLSLMTSNASSFQRRNPSPKNSISYFADFFSTSPIWSSFEFQNLFSLFLHRNAPKDLGSSSWESTHRVCSDCFALDSSSWSDLVYRRTFLSFQ